MTKAKPGTVYLVGAGPGDPELVTVKAASLLFSADLVLHDDLVPQPVLALAGPSTAVVSVGKRCGKKKTTQDQINDRMISSARLGLRVVRLKSGDPAIFGRLGEELDALRQAEVPFEVVPGVSAAFAAAASLGLSLTDRRSNSRVVILSGHHAPDGLLDERQGLNEQSTLIIYMPGPDIRRIRRRLLDAGLDPATPCVLVSRAATREEQAVRSTLENLHVPPAVKSPSILLVGVPETAGIEESLCRSSAKSSTWNEFSVQVTS